MTQNNTPAKKEAGEVTTPEATRGGTFFSPRVDIYETPDEVVLLCDMPGVKPSDVDVKFEKGELSLYGKVTPRSVKYLAAEYGSGDYFRTFAVTPEIDSEKISAEYREGVLTIHLPRQEKVKPKRITVNVS